MRKQKALTIALTSLFYLAFLSPTQAQITEVTVKDGFALVKNASVKGVVKIEVCASCKVAGFNGGHLVIFSGPKAVIYNSKGKQTGTLKLKRGDKIIEVNNKDIIIKETTGYTAYYDFYGSYKKRVRS